MFSSIRIADVKATLGYLLATVVLISTFSISLLPVANLNVAASEIPTFSPSYILNDATVTSFRAFPSAGSVQSFLDSVNSPIRSYREDGILASEIIFKAATGETSTKYGIVPRINPGVILAYLEKEMSLVSKSDYDVNRDPENRMKKAMGYGCPDIGNCDPEYLGFSNQINWATFQLQLNFERADANSSKKVMPYVAGTTLTTLDGYKFVVENKATAMCYRYTPHVFYGCYNLWKIVTANGWGTSSNRYFYDDLDRANLPNYKGGGTGGSVAVSVVEISEAEGQDLLSKYYSLDQNDTNVQKLQRYLKQKGFLQGQNVSSYFDRATAAAVKELRFQSGKLVGNFKSASVEKCRELIGKSFAFATENNDVLLLQKCLTDIGFMDDFNNTGYFGELTTKAQSIAKKWLLNDTTSNSGTGSGTTNPNPTPTPNADPSTDPVPNGTTLTMDKMSDLVEQTPECNLLGIKFTKGIRGDKVKQLQVCLQKLGFYRWPFGATGLYGDYTTEKHNQWIKLQSCEKLKSFVWEYAETSPRVKQMQECLKTANKFDYPTATGFFGPITWNGFNKWKLG
jgi:peptidoglycan hydrolase-like protein with peptidoglycan-binding domain